MSALLPTPMTTVEEVLRALPEAGQIFIKHRTGCVGCRLARFCTLAEVATIYEISLRSLLDDLQQKARSAKAKTNEV
jgi:hybrid cluster-associated redox disulfide protein